MKLIQLNIKKFRSIEKAEIYFDEINAIVGVTTVNGNYCTVGVI